ncbi:hypothetical protein [Synechococcus sp. KORDI-52]|uniref:hypothetical protein n=1 Tax=Synechococcus sp. KORDI-52 TaxID=585425 RepID=UPI000A3DE8A4|nr:hypothetical protein [Synechococcus sp. KORDI-52]
MGTITDGGLGLMQTKEEAALLRILALMAGADGVVAFREQQMARQLWDEHFGVSGPAAWQEALTSAMDLKTAASAIPKNMRPLTLKLSYMVIAACGEERGFPVNPPELYAFNALVNHLELTEDQRELAVKAAKRDLKATSNIWSRLRFRLTKAFEGDDS